jgi:hypothetical protein
MSTNITNTVILGLRLMIKTNGLNVGKMNTLIGIRSNVLYNKKKDDQSNDAYSKYFELVFLVDSPEYARDEKGEILTRRAVNEQRFFVSDEAFNQMINNLQLIHDKQE